MKLLTFTLLLFSIPLFSAATPAERTVVKGCPCLDCPYFVKGQRAGIWKAKVDTPILSAPGGKRKLATIHAGETAVAIGGEMHVTPGELKVVYPKGSFKKGDKVLIVQEDADAGAWKISHNGKEKFEDLSGFVGEKSPCKKPSEKCWAKVVRSTSSIWWVNLQTKEKKMGWTTTTGDFDYDRSSCLER